MNEREQQLGSLFLLPVTLYALYRISNAAFSTQSRKEIGKRDWWTCQADVEGTTGCLTGQRVNGGHPVSFSEGFMVTAAHYDHTKNDQYDHTHNGRILCQMCHAYEELGRGNEWGANRMLELGIYNVHEVRRRGGNEFVTIEDLHEGVRQAHSREGV